MDGNIDDEFKDAVEDPQFEDATDQALASATKTYTDSDGFQIEEPKQWNYDNSFEFESEDLKMVIMEVDPGNTALTKSMLEYKPKEPFLSFGKAKPVRLIYMPL